MPVHELSNYTVTIPNHYLGLKTIPSSLNLNPLILCSKRRCHRIFYRLLQRHYHRRLVLSPSPRSLSTCRWFLRTRCRRRWRGDGIEETIIFLSERNIRRHQVFCNFIYWLVCPYPRRPFSLARYMTLNLITHWDPTGQFETPNID